MQSGVDSEASTCSTDSVSEEDSLKAGPGMRHFAGLFALLLFVLSLVLYIIILLSFL